MLRALASKGANMDARNDKGAPVLAIVEESMWKDTKVVVQELKRLGCSVTSFLFYIFFIFLLLFI